LAVSCVIEFAARKIRKSKVFCGDISKCSSGENISTPAINITPKIKETRVVIIIDVLKILLLSLVGQNLMIEKSSPSLEISISNVIEEIRAVAIPTSFAELNFAASIQKIKPKPAPEMDVRIMKNEFINNGSFS